ncbi:hypothetical protein D3C81_1425150 [compost metagenome]
MTRRARSLNQRLRLELGGEEIVTVALIDQQRQLLPRLGNQHAGIPFAPARPFLPQVAGERLLPPRAIDRITDRRERRY